jgi:NAD(P)-dependent dehydrogenase (short-subunit alcohol dehydrogenase family)
VHPGGAVVISGASTGIGCELALTLAKRGYQVRGWEERRSWGRRRVIVTSIMMMRSNDDHGVKRSRRRPAVTAQMTMIPTDNSFPPSRCMRG